MVLLTLALAVALTPASAQATTLTWSSPFSIDSQARHMSCPSASLCVATASSGNIITSTNPAGGASAWSSASVVSGGGLGAVSCVHGTTFCVTMSVDSSSNVHVWTSDNPTGGASAWTDQGVITNKSFGGAAELSCPSTSLCVAQDGGGTGAGGDPSNPGPWKVFAISNVSAGQIACPSTSFCLNGDGNSYVDDSNDPAGGSYWNRTYVGNVNGGVGSLYGSSCPATNMCLVGAAGGTNNLLYATDPTGGASAWSAATLSNGYEIFTLSCPDMNFCAGGDIAGNLLQSSDPLGGASAWTSTHVDGPSTPAGNASNLISEISCPDETLCVAIDQGGNAIVGTVASDSLSVTKAGPGSGTVTSSPAGIDCGTNCSASFDRGTTVTLTAAPAAGSTFAGWSGACSGTGTCQVTLNGNTTATATFTVTPPGQHALTVVRTGNGSGTVASIPSGISCGTSCSADFADGQLVTLSPSPAAGSQFAGWSGACHGTGGCQLFLTADVTVTATFIKVTHSLTVKLNGNGHGTVTSQPTGLNCGPTCTAAFNDGTAATLLPNPKPGFAFGGWSGAGCLGLRTCRVTMDKDQSLFASFFPSPISVSGSTPTQTIECTAKEPCVIVINLDDCSPPHQCFGAQLAGDSAQASAAPPRVLGHARGRIPAHKRRTVHIKLTPAATRYLRSHHRLKVTEFIITKTGGRRTLTERTFTLIFH